MMLGVSIAQSRGLQEFEIPGAIKLLTDLAPDIALDVPSINSMLALVI